MPGKGHPKISGRTPKNNNTAHRGGAIQYDWMGQACPKQSGLWWGWCPYADADIREMRTSTIGGFLMEPSIVEVAYLPSLLAEWELKSPAGKCPAVGDE